LFKPKQSPRTFAALVAACVIVLQSFFTAWAAGAMPIQPMLDIFGNPLCITSLDKGNKGPVGDHSKLPDCCTFGCTMGSSVLAVAPTEHAEPLRPLLRSRVVAPLYRTDAIQIPDHDPGSPRAPPLTA
jgi:hypothetical protein